MEDRFLKGDDAFKNNRLKLIANISEGPWIVKKAVGEQAICILGRSLTCRLRSSSTSFCTRFVRCHGCRYCFICKSTFDFYMELLFLCLRLELPCLMGSYIAESSGPEAD